MNKFKKLAVVGALVVGAAYAIAAYAYPAPGPGQEVFVTYYSNSARTNEVGVRAISHDSSCDSWHVNWGVTTQYSRVIVTACPGGAGEDWF
jgi:hypothetical protein